MFKSVFLLEIEHLGDMCVFQFWRLDIKHMDQKHPWEVDEETSGNAMLM
jgi:hypothetical protein